MNTGDFNGEMRKLAETLATEDDPREAARKVAERLQDIRTAGGDVPEEFVKLEQSLIDECIAASQGR